MSRRKSGRQAVRGDDEGKERIKKERGRVWRDKTVKGVWRGGRGEMRDERREPPSLMMNAV